MPWGRLNDKANGDDKLLALSDAAWRMWGCGLIYCQDKLTDGFIPDHIIHTFGVKARNKPQIAGELCQVLVPGKGPLWHKVEGGYQVHDYLDWNPSREAVLAKRQQGLDRLQKYRQRRNGGSASDDRNASRNALHNAFQGLESEGCNALCNDPIHVPRTTKEPRTAAAPPGEAGEPVENPELPASVAFASARALASAPKGGNYRVIAKLASELLDRGFWVHASERFSITSESTLIEALKDECPRLLIDRGSHPEVDPDVIHRAAASEWHKHKLGIRRRA